MDYRMFKSSGDIPAGENVVTLIKESMKKSGLTSHTPLQFIGFEAPSGTTFYLNDESNKIEVPACGYFITPFDGQRGTHIYYLSFADSFNGTIYYIP